MIQHPYEVTGGFDDLASKVGHAKVESSPGLVPIAEALGVLCMKIVQENGETYWNENRAAIQAQIDAIRATTTDPGGFIVPQGTEAATRWHLVRTWARFMQRIDLGDNSFLRTALTQISIAAYWCALKSNADAGVSEILVP